MPHRDNFGRLCGPLTYKDKDGNSERLLAILDVAKCLLRFFHPYSYCPKDEKLWDLPSKQIETGLITKIEKNARNTENESFSFEIQMVDLQKHYLEAQTEEEMNEWIQHLHRVAVDPARRQETKKSINSSSPKESKKLEIKTSEEENDSSEGPTSYEFTIIGGVVVKRSVSKKGDSDSESLSGGSHNRSMSRGSGKFKILKEGYLIKKGALVRNWKRRYFTLDMTSLCYYEKDTDKEPIRSIATNDILHTRHSPSSESNKEFLFEVQTGSRTFLIQADSKEEMEDWIKHLKNATHSIQGRSNSGPSVFSSPNRYSLPPSQCMSIKYYSTSDV